MITPNLTDYMLAMARRLAAFTGFINLTRTGDKA